MKVEYIFTSSDQGVCRVSRENGDKKIPKPGWKGVDPDSTFLYHVQQELKKQGYDVIKKRMWKDGHMFGLGESQYLRTRDTKGSLSYYIYDGSYALRLAVDEYNERGKIELNMVWDIGEERGSSEAY